MSRPVHFGENVMFRFVRRALPVLRPGRPAAPAFTEDEAVEFVTWFYRAVFRREPDKYALAQFPPMLCDGSLTPLLMARGAVGSEEYRSMRPSSVDGYSLESDPHLAAFRTPEILSRSDEIRRSAEIDLNYFEEVYKTTYDKEWSGGKEYLWYHKARVLELLNALKLLLRDVKSPRLLEVGASQFTAWYPLFIEGVEVATVDRPGVGPSSVSVSHLDLDLNGGDLSPMVALGKFDAVVFTEVLEHLQANATSILGGLLSVTKESGFVYLTTPNFFRANNIFRISERLNPQDPLPNSNKDAHYHIREYSMSELLEAIVSAGGIVRGWYFSDCWDQKEVLEHERGNMVVVFSPNPAFVSNSQSI